MHELLTHAAVHCRTAKVGKNGLNWSKPCFCVFVEEKKQNSALQHNNNQDGRPVESWATAADNSIVFIEDYSKGLNKLVQMGCGEKNLYTS